MTHTPTPWYVNGFWARSDNRERAGRVAKAEIAFKDSATCADNIDRIVAAVNFFHGQPIPTERIAEGGIGELLWFVEYTAHQRCECNDSTCPSCKACDLLAKLGVEE